MRGSRFQPVWDTFSDTWVATDGVGRKLPTQGCVGPPRKDRWVAIFYFLWHGYDYAINRRLLYAQRSVVELTANGWNWHPMSTARFRVEGNQLMLAVSRESLGLSAENSLRFEFKWADNYELDDDIYAFTIHGDSAPPSRFNYLYRAE